MRIEKLRLINFKKFEDSIFSFHPKCTILIGDNGTGKTAILDALAIAAGSYLLDIPGASKRHIRNDEVRVNIYRKADHYNIEQQFPTEVHAFGKLDSIDYDWRRSLNSKSGKTTRVYAKRIIQLGSKSAYDARLGLFLNLPVIGYYGTGRLWQLKANVPIAKAGSIFIGYRNCLDPKTDSHLFQGWFKQMELAVLQKKGMISILESVRKAVIKCIPNAKNFYYDVAASTLMLEFSGNNIYPFNILSDGYRNIISLVADIAHRAARLNPHLGINASKKASGIILIDEIDEHLHPSWQRSIVETLTSTFPKIQFILTTHSPFIIQSAFTGSVIDLNQVDDMSQPVILPDLHQNIAYPPPNHEYTDRSIEDITEEVMGIPVPSRSERFQNMMNAAKEYYEILESAKYANSSKKKKLKSKLDRLIAPFSDNIAYHAFLEMEAAAAGVGIDEDSE